MTPKPKTPGGKKPGGGGPDGGSGKKRPSSKVGKVDASDVSKGITSTGEFAKAGRPGAGTTPGKPGTTTPSTGGKTKIPKDKFDEIVNTPKGSRPDPSTYMSKADIDAHLKPFRDTGAVRFTSKDGIKAYGTVGNPNGCFAIPRSEFDAVMKRTGGDLGKVEQELGLDPGTLTSGDAVIAYIKPEDLRGLRVPDGNEGGANKQWIPGGYTSGGVPEATINTPADVPYDVIKVKP